jgi:uncharacterized protein YkwD
VRTPTLPNQERKSLRSLRLPLIALLAVLLLMGVVLLATPTQALCAVSYEQEELDFVKLLNDYRVANGLQPVQLCDMVTEACERHNSDMIKYDFFDHVTAGSDWFSVGATYIQRMGASGYTYSTTTGENLVAGISLADGTSLGTAAGALAAWKASSDHNAVMLTPDLKVIGISLAFSIDKTLASGWTDKGWYWTTDFGGVVPVVAPPPPPPPPPVTTWVDVKIPTDGDCYRWRGRVAIQAEAASTTERIRKVVFYIDGTRIGTDYRWPYKKTWNARRVVSGTGHFVTAVAYNRAGAKIGEDSNYVRVW